MIPPPLPPMKRYPKTIITKKEDVVIAMLEGNICVGFCEIEVEAAIEIEFTQSMKTIFA